MAISGSIYNDVTNLEYIVNLSDEESMFHTCHCSSFQQNSLLCFTKYASRKGNDIQWSLGICAACLFTVNQKLVLGAPTCPHISGLLPPCRPIPRTFFRLIKYLLRSRLFLFTTSSVTISLPTAFGAPISIRINLFLFIIPTVPARS